MSVVQPLVAAFGLVCAVTDSDARIWEPFVPESERRFCFSLLKRS
jgi:hypothetical protein